MQHVNRKYVYYYTNMPSIIHIVICNGREKLYENKKPNRKV